MLKNKQDAIRLLMSPFQKPMKKIGITEAYLAKKLKAELCAKEIKAFKAKVLKKSPDGQIVEIEEIIYSKPMVAWDVRQKSRIDAHKLRGDYPPEEHDVNFPNGPIELKVVYEKVISKDNGKGSHGSEDQGNNT